MRKSFFFSGLVLVLLSISIVYSCRRVDHVILKRLCRIEMMNAYTFRQDPVPRYFTYNQSGNPVRVSFDDSPGTGTPFYDFFYNDKQQLIQFNEFSDHFYTYDDRGLVIVDTTHSYYTGEDFWYEEKFFYDDENRIIKTIFKIYQAPTELPDIGVEHVTEYVYDSRGNLVRPGVSYDNKTNPRRTNKIWMFVDKDYSVNNPIPGPTAYNELGLPLNNITFLGNHATEVFYDCKKSIFDKWLRHPERSEGSGVSG